MSASPVEADELDVQYQSVFGEVSGIIDAARRSAARSVNAVMTAAYWLIGRYVVEFEQSGEERAAYGTALIERLALDLKTRFGRGFSRQNLQQMRAFYLTYPPGPICQTVSGKSSESAAQTIRQTPSGESEDVAARHLSTASAESSLASIASRFPLPASLVRLYSVALAQEPTRPRVLRSGDATRRMVRSPARPADQLPVL